MTCSLTRRALLAGVGATAALPLQAAPSPLLEARGAQLFYGGRPIILRGVAPGDPLLGRPERPTDDYRRIAQEWNANVVRLSVHPGAWKREPDAVLVKLDRDVAAALAADKLVFLMDADGVTNAKGKLISTLTVAESAEPEQVTPPAEVGDPAAWAAAYLDSLSEERQDALQKELWRRAAKKAQEQYKYQLPTDLRLYGLEWHNRGANKLDDSQKSRLRQLAESFRPRMDAALQAAWAEDAALNEQISAASSSGRHEEMAGLFEKKHQIMQQINTIKADLDKEYRESVRSILTPEQLQYLDASQGQVIQSWGGERPR